MGTSNKFGNYSPEETKLTKNDFIPEITLDKTFSSKGKYLGNVDIKKTSLSKYLDSNQQPLDVVKITVPAIIRLNMKKGSSKANDNEGDIKIVTDGVYLRTEKGKKINHYKNTETNRILSKAIYEDMSYDDNKLFKIKVTPVEIQKNAYIDFFCRR